MKFTGVRTTTAFPFAERSCADCENYFPEVKMIDKADGRKVCKGCDGKSKDKAAKKQQLAFFGQESLI